MHNIVEINSASVEDKPLHTVKFDPYRGEIEPITKVHVALINFYAELIEVILHYEHIEVTGDEKSDGLVRFAEMLPRNSFTVSLASSSHPDDDEERVPTVFLHSMLSNVIYLRCKTQKQAEEVYRKLKEWMLS